MVPVVFFVCIKITCEITCQSGQSLHTLQKIWSYWRQQLILWNEQWTSIFKMMAVLNGSLMQIVNNDYVILTNPILWQVSNLNPSEYWLVDSIRSIRRKEIFTENQTVSIYAIMCALVYTKVKIITCFSWYRRKLSWLYIFKMKFDVPMNLAVQICIIFEWINKSLKQLTNLFYFCIFLSCVVVVWILFRSVVYCFCLVFFAFFIRVCHILSV